jgi:hypothetical protein
LEKVWKRFSRPAHDNSAARRLKRVMAHQPNDQRPDRHGPGFDHNAVSAPPHVRATAPCLILCTVSRSKVSFSLPAAPLFDERSSPHCSQLPLSVALCSAMPPHCLHHFSLLLLLLLYALPCCCCCGLTAARFCCCCLRAWLAAGRCYCSSRTSSKQLPRACPLRPHRVEPASSRRAPPTVLCAAA